MRLRSLVRHAARHALLIGAAAIVGSIGGYGYAMSSTAPMVVTHTVTVPAPTTDGLMSVSWVVAEQHPTPAEVAQCGAWVPAVAVTRQGGQTVSQPLCAPTDGTAVAANGTYVAGIVGR